MLLIPDDSPLRNPPADLEPVQKVAFDGARFAFDMVHVGYLRLVSTLEAIGRELRGGRRLVEQPTIALVDAWAVVDNVWRLHNVLRRFPGLKRSPEMEVHLRALAKVEDLRHGIQHLDQKLRKVASGKDPLLGSLTWLWTPDEPLTKAWGFAIAAGSAREGWTPVVNPAGRKFHRPIGLVTLAAFGCELELTGLVVRVVELAKGLDRGARVGTGKRAGGVSDLVMALHFEIASEPGNKP
jgi:hypothetical protein